MRPCHLGNASMERVTYTAAFTARKHAQAAAITQSKSARLFFEQVSRMDGVVPPFPVNPDHSHQGA